ncbi:translation initiation factor IF-2 [Cuniculiplasma divulgatum]|jgi:translation initiation factor 5B|uniref:Translation initiation factor IF-2 n=1 Tax=Cuniculiplasma divulgatum TaxID=1673428 RepID=A0A1N5VDE8_9ARCH|nr:translation initiation factor IF-2 [Cuniculiplasma divulgatum]MCI2411957.1 translation initiation factor IF-2 [Cuniculiplasma sp.]MCL4320939.1 translation initiation factor IF-2 [Candidatus Thermoplasmatota archaeon]WMT49463.1 MAG: translation initiation factor IF-2 [Thermoplasmatales archaeon]SIM71124.1 translation initiation factor aIF2/5B [Cuniculiplasma divulgatum]SJK85141.1 translation initiation factor aIF2/5B [Cuniculiplasma divulgatum]
MEALRQPIVCVLGHVDHGKTSILDSIRGTSLMKKESGGITQRIGATEISIQRIIEISGGKISSKMFKIPGLLFVDTPGHVAFANMRTRGGALADIAILVIDINDGIMPQTVESINILRKFKTPFIIVANKIDTLAYFIKPENTSFSEFLKEQRQEYIDELDNKLYAIINQLYQHNLTADRFDRITDFTKNVSIVPSSAKYSIGILEILMTISGLAQRFLTPSIALINNLAKANVLEIRREESLGMTLDSILYQGKLKTGMAVYVNTSEGPKETKIKALFTNVSSKSTKVTERSVVNSASGVRIAISDKLDVIPGTTLIEAKGDIDSIIKELQEESQVKIDLDEHGITLKADTLGSLEAVAFELGTRGIKIRSTQIGEISKRDLIDVSTLPDQMDRILAGFNVDLSTDAKNNLMNYDVAVVASKVIYSLIEEIEKWLKNKKEEMDEESKQGMPIPSKLVIMPEYIFRAAKPIIVGVKILSGRIKVGDNMIRDDGKYAGTIKSIRDGEVSKRFAEAGQEVAVAIDGVTLNRQISADQPIYVDITEDVVKKLKERSLDEKTMETLEEIIKIKRKENIFWGTRV